MVIQLDPMQVKFLGHRSRFTVMRGKIHQRKTFSVTYARYWGCAHLRVYMCTRLLNSRQYAVVTRCSASLLRDCSELNVCSSES